MKHIVFFLLTGVLLLSCSKPMQENVTAGETQPLVSQDSVRDGVFIHITESYNDPHRVLMPMKMATVMANDKDVLIYLDIHAVELVVMGAKDLNFPEFESFQSYIKQLTNAHIGIYACPTCLKVAGIKPSELMHGIQVAQKDRFFDFTKGRIITLDY